ncbi:MAG: porin [Candidatus Dadabacteria bacterium]|nr:porin [Candidatus Dadabacteria bacterium]MYA48433.1 porin [Candidatus Dadabacteria bacterium]MYG83510.1 porin [Candidatus Dadabacteria bacterium]MYK48916.1 porin [Candidatus Dadabacteria bacterium]
MYRFINNGLMICLLACASLVISLPAFAGGGGDISEESMAEEAAPEEAMAEEAASEEAMVEEAPLIKDTDVSIYGRFWPRVTYNDVDGGDSSTDITDALSRVGIKANTQITETLSAVLHGEWDVDIEKNGNFGDARQAYVGLRSEDLGMVAIGKQWDPYFNIVAEVTDIFYHRASPFGYDQQGPFRSSNLVTYANGFGGLKINAGMQVDGVSGSNDGGTHSDNVDAASIGVGLSSGPVYIGVSYLRQNQDDRVIDGNQENRDRNFFGVGGSLNVNDDIYLAVTYQYITDNYDDGRDLNPYTLDVASSFSFSHGVTALAGFFMSDPDDGNEWVGGNLTLIKEVHPALDVFAEWVLTDEDQGDTINTFSLGFRYDFDVAIF